MKKSRFSETQIVSILNEVESGLCHPLNGKEVIAILKTQTGCGLLDRLITQDYRLRQIVTLTNDRKMENLEGAERL
ncbi:MAG: hypothetical protein ACON4K_04700 [Akkermansiaceae bacterium]